MMPQEISEEVARVLERATDNLRGARLLKDNDFFAMAVSRVYYTMLYCAEALLLQRGKTFSSHRAVIAAFGREFAATERLDPHLHRYLIDAFSRRQRMDYDHWAESTAREAEQQIRRAEEFLHITETYLSGSGDPASPPEPDR